MNKLLRRAAPYAALWYMLGSMYLTVEGVWRGWTHISMMIVGGICGLCIGAINQMPKFFHLRIAWQSLIGAAIVLVIELAAGCVLNLWLGLGIWDYSGMPGSVCGQICLLYGLIWFGLTPLAIWAEDKFRRLLYHYYRAKGATGPDPPCEDYSLISIYRDLFAGR